MLLSKGSLFCSNFQQKIEILLEVLGGYKNTLVCIHKLTRFCLVRSEELHEFVSILLVSAEISFGMLAQLASGINSICEFSYSLDVNGLPSQLLNVSSNYVEITSNHQRCFRTVQISFRATQVYIRAAQINFRDLTIGSEPVLPLGCHILQLFSPLQKSKLFIYLRLCNIIYACCIAGLVYLLGRIAGFLAQRIA